jgi:hypothetical protein
MGRRYRKDNSEEPDLISGLVVLTIFGCGALFFVNRRVALEVGAGLCVLILLVAVGWLL